MKNPEAKLIFFKAILSDLTDEIMPLINRSKNVLTPFVYEKLLFKWNLFM